MTKAWMQLIHILSQIWYASAQQQLSQLAIVINEKFICPEYVWISHQVTNPLEKNPDNPLVNPSLCLF